MLSIRAFAGFVLAVSAAVLGAALLSQYWGGLAPCELCLLQRWPWAVAIVISLVAVLVGDRPGLPWVALILGLVFAAGVVFAFYHVGVEQHWFAGPVACTASTGAMTLEEMKRQIITNGLFAQVDASGFNLLASLIMAAICSVVFVRTRRPATRNSSALHRGAS